MRNLLPFIFILACPIMMIFMMRGMHGGQGNSKAGHDMHMGQAGHDTHVRQDDAGAQNLQAPEERIAAIEHELAQLRSLQGRQSDNDKVRGS